MLPSRSDAFMDTIDNIEVFKEKILGKITQLTSLQNKIGREGLVRFVWNFCEMKMNTVLAPLPPPSCKKGCSFCCYIPVSISTGEASILAKYLKPEDLPILKKQLGKRNSFKGMPQADRKCVFLKDNICSVYEDRPLSCRSYFVFSDPALCNTENDIINPVATCASEEAELTSIALHLIQESDFMPEQLLKALL